MRRSNRLAGGALAAFSALVALFIIFIYAEDFPFHESARLALKERLTLVRTPVAAAGEESRERSAIYVMGGHPFNLRHRFGIAAGLYSDGLAAHLLILSRPGITEYDPSLGRNLTKDEWAVRELAAYGVGPDEIELVELDEGFFGTLGETEAVSALAASRGYERLFVVSSLPHTLRVWLAFSNALEGTGVELFIDGSDDPVGMRELLRESAKVLVYRYILL